MNEVAEVRRTRGVPKPGIALRKPGATVAHGRRVGGERIRRLALAQEGAGGPVPSAEDRSVGLPIPRLLRVQLLSVCAGAQSTPAVRAKREYGAAVAVWMPDAQPSPP
ncbi:hypothetical protein FHW64_005422 [Variovorax sp. Sphag1AA]|nr:hypothetical protein [Variovorax sp. Sphag1AA]